MDRVSKLLCTRQILKKMFEKPAMSCQVLNLNVHSREVGGGGNGYGGRLVFKLALQHISDPFTPGNKVMNQTSNTSCDNHTVLCDEQALNCLI